MTTRKKYKNDKQNSDIALEELRKRYSKMCNNSDCVSYLFDELSLKDVKERDYQIHKKLKYNERNNCNDILPTINDGVFLDKWNKKRFINN